MKARLSTAALMLALAGPALAQTTTPNATSDSTAQSSPLDNQDHDHGNWGWLGLLGLIGLAPLFMRKDRQGNIQPDTRR